MSRMSVNCSAPVARLSAVLLSAFLAVSSSHVQAATPAGSGEPPRSRDYLLVQPMRVMPTISVGGTVVPYKEVTLAAQLPGSVEYVGGREGERFAKGDLLVVLDDDELLARRRNAEAQFRNAEARLRNAGVQYSRELYAPYSLNKSPGGMGLPTLMDQFFTRPFSNTIGTSSYLERHADLHDIGTQVEEARNALFSARSQIQRIDTRLSNARSRAPFDGVIVRKMVEAGDTVQPGQPLVKFADMNRLEIEVDAPARLVSGLERFKHERRAVSATLDSDEQEIRVAVAHVFPVADAQRHTVTVKFALPSRTRARPGMYATVRVPDFLARQQDRIVIPKSAVVRRGSLPGVYVRNLKGASELRAVRLGEAFNQEWIMVLSGLKQGDEILRDVGGGTEARSGNGFNQSQVPSAYRPLLPDPGYSSW